jgi:hypothetical protein
MQSRPRCGFENRPDIDALLREASALIALCIASPFA